MISGEDLPGALRAVQRRGIESQVVRLNETDFLPAVAETAPASTAFGFRFLANRAPFNEYGGVLEFSEIAQRSEGAAYLGLLKADLDRLGAIFRRGLGGAMSISRLATLSSAIDLFFTGWIGCLADRTAVRLGHEENPFYIMYAGGDDLLLVGPWDATIALAQDLEADLHRFCCGNANLTVSAAVECVKPHLPVRRFARMLATALDRAKEDRNRIQLFGASVPWRDDANAVDRLVDLGRLLADAVRAHRIPRTLVHDLVAPSRSVFRAGRESGARLDLPHSVHGVQARPAGGD
jgi:CRISPR-associated protein Csm1